MTDARADASDVRATQTEDNVLALRGEVADLKAGTLGLTNQVESLSGALTAMNTLQQRQQAQEDHLNQVERTVVPRDELAVRERQLRAEPRRIVHWGIAFLLIFVPLAAYIAIWMHELYRDACHVPGTTPPAWCGEVFPFDDNRPDHLHR